MKSILRAASMRVPPIRRLYTFAMQQAQAAQELAAVVEAANARAAALEHDFGAARARAAALEQEVEARGAALQAAEARAVDERDSLDLQLYVLRSDHQRTAARNEELAAALRAMEGRAARDAAALHTMEARAAQDADALRAMEAQGAQDAGALRAMEAQAAQDAGALRAMEARGGQVTPDDLSTVYAKIAGRMTLLSSEITRLHPSSITAGDGGRTLYLDLMERALTGMLGEDAAMDPWTTGYDPEVRLIGRDWPSKALTMIGLARMRNLRVLAEGVVQEGIPGDMLEAGVWRGGACILMRGVLAAHGVTDRTVWVADSFEGLPAADPATYPADAGDMHATVDALRVSSEEVEANFLRYSLLDQQVRFLQGWFADTLPAAPIDRLAILRLDGDMYSSTIQTLDALYDKVSPGGYIIIDDYILAGCRQAVDDFRGRRELREEIYDVDGACVFWRKHG